MRADLWGRYPGREKNNAAGGWAGGEKGLWQLREELTAKPPVLPKPTPRASEPVSVDLVRDFGALGGGGFPGGEVGLGAFVETVRPETAHRSRLLGLVPRIAPRCSPPAHRVSGSPPQGKVPTRAAPAYVGAGAYLAVATAAAFAACTLATGDPNPTHWTFVAAGTEPVPGQAGSERKVVVLPSAPPPQLVATVGPYAAAAAGAVAAGMAIRDGLAATAAALARGVRLAALGVAAGAVAGKILQLW